MKTKINLILIALILGMASLSGGAATGVAADFHTSALESTLSILPVRLSGSSGSAVSESRPEEPEGSGVVVFDGRYVATAAHVLNGADRVRVRMHDGRVAWARIVGQDRFTDIALLHIGDTLPPFVVSEDVSVGDDVCTVGNQFGLGLSITCGVISAVHRSNAGFNPIEDFIQTDAVVNPGASGGALINDHGRLVGMLSGIFTKDSDADVGVNFAVHGPFLMRILEDLKDHGRVRRAKSGMVVQALSLVEREDQTGVRILRIAADSAAARAGLRPDDVIVTMAGRHIRYPSDVSAIVYGHRVGDAITLERERDGVLSSVDLILGE